MVEIGITESALGIAFILSMAWIFYKCDKAMQEYCTPQTKP
jgi:hypothetical protein